MTKHTPGPWRIQDKRTEFTVYGSTSEFGYSKTAMCQAIAHIPQYPKQISECEANARLIAAAPEMLEALRQLLYELELRCKDDMTEEQFNAIRAVSITRAAIAKAKGE